MATPDVEEDLVARLVALVPATFKISPRNIWAGDEQPVGGAVAQGATFVLFTGDRDDVHNDGQTSELDCQILHRFARDDYAAAKTRMRAAYDALHLSGAFTSSAGAKYTDIRAIDRPFLLSPIYLALNVTLWLDG